MKTLLVCILISVFTAHVLGGGGGRGGGGDSSEEFGRGGDIFGLRCGPGDDYGKVGRCNCTVRWGSFFSGWNACQGVTGTKGCPNTNQYLQCSSGGCTVTNCTDGQVWNKTQNACAPCTTGMHVAANKLICVCNEGTTFDPMTRSCVACPTDATVQPDTCFCPSTKAIDYKKNACKDCPAGSTLTDAQRCQCGVDANNVPQFWSDTDWSCKSCPGVLQPKPTRRLRQPPSKCVCTGTNEIFVRESVQCYTCPTGTTASRDNSYCQCPNRFQGFNMDTKQCECAKGFQADAAGTGCVWSAVVPGPPAPAPGNP